MTVPAGIFGHRQYDNAIVPHQEIAAGQQAVPA